MAANNGTCPESFSLTNGSIGTNCLIDDPFEIVPEDRALHVSLFPYIPNVNNDNHKTLINFLYEAFKRERPDIDLSLTISLEEDPYDMAGVAKRLSAKDENRRDLILADTILLAELEPYIQPWEGADTADWHEVARNVVILKDKVYGVPHFLCSYFIYGFNQEIKNINSLKTLSSTLESFDRATAKILADLSGSWTLPVIYLDALRDSYPNEDLRESLYGEIPPKVISHLREFFMHCEIEGYNPCLEGIRDSENLVKSFIERKYHATINYFEALHDFHALNPNISRIYFSSLALGEESHPLFFTDAFVLRKGCSGKCAQNAQAFIEFINHPNILSSIMMSKDVGGKAIPRYLIPATKSAFQDPAVQQDTFYREVEEVVLKGYPFPNGGLSDMRQTLRNKLLEEMRNDRQIKHASQNN